MEGILNMKCETDIIVTDKHFLPHDFINVMSFFSEKVCEYCSILKLTVKIQELMLQYSVPFLKGVWVTFLNQTVYRATCLSQDPSRQRVHGG